MTDNRQPQSDASVNWRAYRQFIAFSKMCRETDDPGIGPLRKYGLADMTRADLEQVMRCNEICQDVQAEELQRIKAMRALMARYKAKDVQQLSDLVPASDEAGRTVLFDWCDFDDEAEEAARRLGRRYEGMLIDGIEDDPDDDPNFWVAALRAGLLGPTSPKAA